MIATKKNKTTFTCTNCNANHAQWFGKCFKCNSWNTIQESAPKNIKSDLDIFFQFAREHELENGDCKCENCGKPIRHQLMSKDVWVWRSTIAHVIPKKTFVSTSTHVYNFLIMCLSCHGQYDSSWSNATKMPVFALAKTKFKLFKPSIKESISKIEKYFKD